MKLAGILPCRIIGDPLQGIFDFEDCPLVNWNDDLIPHFEQLDGLDFPWRWNNKNDDLGRWLHRVVRPCLLEGKPIDFRRAPVNWLQVSPNNIQQNQRRACLNAINNNNDSVVAICKWANQAHHLARNLNGSFTSMEEVESKDLLDWSDKFERLNGKERAIAVIDFASRCMTQVSTQLRTIRGKLEQNDLTISAKMKYQNIANALYLVATSHDLLPILKALYLIENIERRVLYRRELWYDMRKTLLEHQNGKDRTLRETAWSIRDNGRIWGRKVENRAVSRTLLIKGLEFNHAIILNADNNDVGAKELYVALTRGSHSLTVLSSTPVIRKDAPFN